jgi:hypothetical protein
MSGEAKPGRSWLVPACLLAAVLIGGFLGRTAQQPGSSAAAQTSAAKVPSLAPDSPLPTSTPPFSPLGPDLVGRVVSTHGDSIAGAGVFIDAARPRVGRGYT